MFEYQTILFGPELKNQQSDLFCYYYETNNGESKINQFEFTLVEMERPEYWSEDEIPQLSYGIYPNPTDGTLNVSLQLPQCDVIQTYRITNITGQTILTGSINAETQQIDVSDLPTGMYFISVGNTTKKFVVR